MSFGCSALAWAQEGVSAGVPGHLGWLAEAISRHGIGVGLVAVFFGGLALNLTPCVYPMIPVTLAFFSSQAAGVLRRTLVLPLLYVVGLSLSYAVLGLLAAATGALFGSWLQRPAVLIALTLVIVALSASMFGFYELRLPRAITSRLGQASSGLWGAFLMGLMMGLVAAPCIGPFILSLLLLIGQLRDPVAGFLLFFVLGFGMGLPYLFLGMAATRLSRLPKGGGWLVWSKHALGLVLLGLALFFLKPLLPAWAVKWGAAALLFAGGLHLGWLARVGPQGPRFSWLRRGVGLVLLVSAVTVSWAKPQASEGVTWTPYTAAGFEQAVRAHRPVLVDVYADWCLPCVELDHVTFRHPEVVQALSAVVTLRVDATREVPRDAERLFERYDVYGVPTVLLFDRNGRERPDLRLLGFEEPEEFLRRLTQLQSATSG